MSADVAAAADRVQKRIEKDLHARGVEDAAGRARSLIGPAIPRARAMREAAQRRDSGGPAARELEGEVPATAIRTHGERVVRDVPAELLDQAQVELDTLQRRGRSTTVAGYRDTPFSRQFWESLK